MAGKSQDLFLIWAAVVRRRIQHTQRIPWSCSFPSTPPKFHLSRMGWRSGQNVRRREGQADVQPRLRVRRARIPGCNSAQRHAHLWRGTYRHQLINTMPSLTFSLNFRLSFDDSLFFSPVWSFNGYINHCAPIFITTRIFVHFSSLFEVKFFSNAVICFSKVFAWLRGRWFNFIRRYYVVY